MSGSEHYSVDLFENDEGWFRGVCVCGWDGGMFPTAEDACDALMGHAYYEGALAVQRAVERQG
jgi:hypothetical protein